MSAAIELDPQLWLTHPDSTIISPRLAMLRRDGFVTFFNASGPVYACRADDVFGLRVAAATLTDPDLGLATAVAMASALGWHRNSVAAYRATFREQGASALVPQRPGPQGPHKLKGERLTEAQSLLDGGASQREVARTVGVNEATIRHALKLGHLHRPAIQSAGAAAPQAPGEGPGQRSDRDAMSEGGVAVKRHTERALARVGKLIEAPPEFQPAVAVARGGVLVAIPALIEVGLLDVTEQVYGKLRNGFFGLRAVMMTFVLMTLLRLKSIEALTAHAPGEFGIVLGLDRAPEMKTLRRKLAEMAERQQASACAAALTRRWVKEEPELLGFLYVDGHVRPYHGRTHTLPKTHVQQRRLCMPATTDYWVNSAGVEPLFVVTAPANDGLLKMLDDEILPRARELAGEGRRITLIFDREGWSPKRFATWFAKNFDVLTYRKGRYAPWAERCFETVEVKVNGVPVKYRLAERIVPIRRGFRMREVRRLCDDGHQTAIVTTRRDLGIGEVAVRMFSRWQQENFFRYMRHEFALDHMPTTAVEEADPERTVPNPARKALQKERTNARSELAQLERDYGGRALDNPEAERPTVRGFKIAHSELGRRIEAAREACRTLDAQYAELPKRVPVGDTLDPSRVVRLERERKIITDLAKMTAYRVETSLAALVAPHLAGRADEARKFIKEVMNAPADIRPDPDNEQLVVRLYSLDTPRANRALAHLCETLTESRSTYPGTRLRLVFEAPRAQ